MSKRITISKLLTRGNAGFFRALILVLAGFVFSVSAQGQYTGGSGDGHTTDSSYTDYCTPAIGAKVTTTCSGVTFQVSPTDGVNGDFVPGSTTYAWLSPSAVGGITGLTGDSGAA